MVVTDRFVFLHLHKSGGTFVLDCLRRFIGSARTIGFHLPRSRIPAEHAGLPVLGFVRNPWSYYVSWYHFQRQRQTPNALFRVVSENGGLDFEATVRNLLELGQPGAGSRQLQAVIEALPHEYGDSGLQLPRYALQPIHDSGLGFYSYMYDYFFGAPSLGTTSGNLTVERSEQLRERLLCFLEGVQQPISDAMRAFVREAPARNTSTHRPYADYYSHDLRDLVAERDRSLIDRHRYAFGE